MKIVQILIAVLVFAFFVSGCKDDDTKRVEEKIEKRLDKIESAEEINKRWLQDRPFDPSTLDTPAEKAAKAKASTDSTVK